MFKMVKKRMKTKKSNPAHKTILFLGCCVQLTKIVSKSCFAILRIKQFKKTNLVRLPVWIILQPELLGSYLQACETKTNKATT